MQTDVVFDFVNQSLPFHKLNLIGFPLQLLLSVIIY